MLPDGYTTIRHYGLLAAGNVNTKLARARALLEQRNTTTPPPDTTMSAGTASQSDSTAVDAAKPRLRCPHCAGTVFTLVATLLPQRHRRNYPPPHT